MASVYKKVINGKPYYYLREMGWVDGKPKMVSERYLGSVADIVKAMDAAEAGMMPQRTGHLAFGDVARGVVADHGPGRARRDRRGGRCPPVRRRRLDRHVSGVGRVGQVGGAPVEEGVRRLVGRHRRGPEVYLSS